MSYVSPNFKTKKELKLALAQGKRILVFQPGLGSVPVNGDVYIEGPHGVHKWYAKGTMKNGVLVKVS